MTSHLTLPVSRASGLLEFECEDLQRIVAFPGKERQQAVDLLAVELLAAQQVFERLLVMASRSG